MRKPSSPTGRLNHGVVEGRWSGRMFEPGSPYSFGGMQYRKEGVSQRYSGKLSDYMVQLRNGSSPENRIDDVFDRRLKKFEAYCMADVYVERLIYADYADIELRILLAMLCGYTVQSPHRRLKAPYGNNATGNKGTHISIQWRGSTGIALGDGTVDPPWPTRQRADMIGGLTVGWGCPEFIAKKVAECMFASGRYDCIVTVSEVSLRNLDNALEQLGAVVIVLRANYRGQRDEDFK